VTGIVDFHNHLVPGVDDGARDAAESSRALAAMAAEGVTALVTTPHVELSLASRGAMTERLAELDRGWSTLVTCAEGVMDVRRGAELRLDAADPDLDDGRLRLDGGRFALVEFPFFAIPPRSTRLLSLIVQRGWVPVIAHPERYAGIDPRLDVVGEWRAAGALLQVNGGSLLGRHGERARTVAIALLGRGWADYLSSDYHARGQPRIGGYRAWLSSRGGNEQADLLTRTNPARLLRGESPLPVRALVTPDDGEDDTDT
jgi:protein-tyrosine phosphatase